MTVYCQRDGCNKSWPIDPALLVDCPTCLASVESRCMRPSGHRVFGGGVHPARDIKAAEAGKYGECPLRICGLKPIVREPKAQGSLF